MKPAALPGSVPKGIGSYQQRAVASNQADLSGTINTGLKLRGDFQQQLEARLEGWLGQPGSERYENLKDAVKPFMRDTSSNQRIGTSRLDLSKLSPKAQQDLEKLQHAAEGLEAVFVKKLLSQMRNVSFSKEKPGPMADFARDLMDQTVSEQAAKGRSSIGIAKMVFLDTAQTVVKSAMTRPDDNEQGQ